MGSSMDFFCPLGGWGLLVASLSSSLGLSFSSMQLKRMLAFKITRNLVFKRHSLKIPAVHDTREPPESLFQL